MIENLWILTKEGVLLFSKNFVKLSKPDDLLAGFFTAVDIFIRAILMSLSTVIVAINARFLKLKK